MDAFVYGTLCDPTQARQVLGHAEFGPDARLLGMHRIDGTYPTLAPGGTVEGRVLRLSDDDLETVDRYEGLDRGLYVRVRVPGGSSSYWTYVGDPDALGVDVTWPGDGSLERRVERYIRSNDVRIER